MDWLTFLAICIAVIPIQVITFLCLFWFRKKFDKYENIALRVINKYIETDESPQIHCLRLTTAEGIEPLITQHEKNNSVAVLERKRILLESSIRAIAHTLKDRYRSENIILNEGSSFVKEYGFLGTTVDQISSEIDKNPLISAGLDLISGAWIYLASEEKNY